MFSVLIGYERSTDWMCLEKKTCVQDRPYLRRRRPNRPQGRTSQTSLTAAEAEVEAEAAERSDSLLTEVFLVGKRTFVSRFFPDSWMEKGGAISGCKGELGSG